MKYEYFTIKQEKHPSLSYDPDTVMENLLKYNRIDYRSRKYIFNLWDKWILRDKCNKNIILIYNLKKLPSNELQKILKINPEILEYLI